MFNKEKISFLNLPTPIEKLDNISKDLGINLYLKRDDLTNIGMGGNKLRKLEFFLKDAKDQGATMLLTTGGAQTNHGRLTAAVAAKYNMKCAIFTFDNYPGEISSNILLDRIFGADLIFRKAEETPGNTRKAIEEITSQYEAHGEKVYYIPMGGSSPIGSLGYYHCAKEIDEQAQALSIVNPRVVVSVGSLGTYLGLYCGIKDMNLPLRLTGITIAPFDGGVNLQGEKLLSKINSYFGSNIKSDSFDLEEKYDFGDYNNPVKEIREAIYYMGKREGIIVDPCYTGKSFYGICKMVEEGKIQKGENVIFIHTGGSPGINALNHRTEFEEELLDGIK